MHPPTHAQQGTDGRPVKVIDHVYIGDRNAAKVRAAPLFTYSNVPHRLVSAPLV
jgi:hypothetical protein